MIRDVQLKKYNKKMDYSYSMGTFPTIELLKFRADKVLKILIHSDLYKDKQLKLITSLCEKYNIPIEENSKAIERIRDKEKCLVIGIFTKYTNTLSNDKNHIVLVNPSDMGNMGTIIRTCLGFGIKDLAIISPGVDIYNPKVVRASMGAMFHMNFSYYETFQFYNEINEGRNLFPFMLEGATDIGKIKIAKEKPYSLIFGNESSGLDKSFSQIGTSVFINHTGSIDSLNLAMAVGIGLYEFSK